MQTGSDDHLKQLTQQLADYLLDQHYQVAAAESCTGGWFAKCCTDLAGSSAWFERGFVTYSNEAKQAQLSVPETIIEQFGAVSEQTAQAMARGALQHSQADITIAVTGIAGPTRGSEAKPVGTVCFGFAQKNQPVLTLTCHFDGDRETIRRQALVTAFQTIIKNARGRSQSMG